jgi:hypothetical protein
MNGAGGSPKDRVALSMINMVNSDEKQLLRLAFPGRIIIFSKISSFHI